MRSSTKAVADPWAPDIDNGWRDLVVSSAPPPPREAYEPLPKNRMLPADLHTWQEHGKPITAEHPKLEEPHFTDGDRRLWMIAGALMGLAVLVLGVLGFLTFGPTTPVADETPAAAMTLPAPTPVESAHEHAPASVEKRAAIVSAAVRPTVGARAAKHTKHAKHRKRVAQR